jgi:D-alanyl-D-alanine carboxypeptidase/D-alanyl-D-alanine-endopeptidase (penicillin-binding protein 4)
MTTRLWLLALAGLGLMSASLTAAEIQRELPARVAGILKAYSLPADSYSAWVQEIDSDEPLLAVNATEPRNPASTIKLLTTFLALEDLGPAYTWTTEVYLGGPAGRRAAAGRPVFQGPR